MGVSQPSSVPCVGGGSSGDVGCVVGPVTAGGALPGDGDGDVDAEHAGQDCGGQVGGKLEKRGGAGFPGVQAELSESLGELVGAHWCTMVMSVILDGSLMHPRCRWIIAMAA